jgi:hypothetical protein
MTQVELLKKVTIRIRAATEPQTADAAPGRSEFAFICGIGRTGITPFESLLAGRRVGDEVDLHVSPPEAAKFFEHLAPLLRPALDGRDAGDLKVMITGIESVEGRDLVKALAEMTSHEGTGCDCGCG